MYRQIGTLRFHFRELIKGNLSRPDTRDALLPKSASTVFIHACLFRKTCIPEEVFYTYTDASNTSLILNVELLNTVNHSIHTTFTTADILVLIKQVI